MKKLYSYLLIHLVGSLFVIAASHLMRLQVMPNIAGVCIFAGATIAPYGWGRQFIEITNGDSGYLNKKLIDAFYSKFWMLLALTSSYVMLVLSLIAVSESSHILGVTVIAAGLPFQICILMEAFRRHASN